MQFSRFKKRIEKFLKVGEYLSTQNILTGLHNPFRLHPTETKVASLTTDVLTGKLNVSVDWVGEEFPIPQRGTSA